MNDYLKNVVFRVDSSYEIGTGHVMRCLSLAEGLRKRGFSCRFISRNYMGNIISHVENRGFSVHILVSDDTDHENINELRGRKIPHAHWLGVSQERDVNDFNRVIEVLDVDWIIIDHYALGVDWESKVHGDANILVIDDLADRHHVCHILLDQTLGRYREQYEKLVPPTCDLLLGPSFALLRSEFAELRTSSVSKRIRPMEKILVSLGGVDKDNVASLVIQALALCKGRYAVTVVAGVNNPNIEILKEVLRKVGYDVELVYQVSNMAAFVEQADLCIGAAGSSSWERCALGLPSINLVLAENQQVISASLAKAGASIDFGVMTFDRVNELADLVDKLADDTDGYLSMVEKAAAICDGLGVNRVISQMLETSS